MSPATQCLETQRPGRLLIYPPITDPTSPYHSLTYLDSYARSRGYPAADIVDVNVEAFHYSYTPGAAAWLAEQLAAVRARRSPARPAGSGPSQPAPGRRPRIADAVRSAVGLLQDPARFYDYDLYQRSVDQIQAWMNCLGAIGFPGSSAAGSSLGRCRSSVTARPPP